MSHLYFFISSKKDDSVRQITVNTTSVKRAISMATHYFKVNNAEGVPQLLAI